MSFPLEKVPPDNSLERHRSLSATEIVLDLSMPFFNALSEYSNIYSDVDISMKALFCYHDF